MGAVSGAAEVLASLGDADRAAVLSDPRVVRAVRAAVRDLEMRRTYAGHRAAGATVSASVWETAGAFGVSDERVRSVIYGKQPPGAPGQRRLRR